MTRIAVPALAVLIAVASFVGLAGWNRAGATLPAMTLTERELTWSWSPDSRAGEQLYLRFEPRTEPLDARNWLPEPKLRALGFPLTVPAGDPAAAVAYARVPARLAWVVLEYDGPAFAEIERGRALRSEGRPQPSALAPSRLVPVDAGLDPGPLRARYGDGHLIVRAILSLGYSNDPMLYAWVRELVPAGVTVPRHLVPVLDGLGPDRAMPASGQDPSPAQSPRYEVDVRIGRLGVPFVTAMRRLGE